MLSKGSICVSDTGEVGVGVIRVQMTDGDNPRPYCTDNRFRIDELTLSASADLSRTVNVSSDVITAYDIHKTDTAVPLGRSMFAPGLNNGNPVSTINFETVWSATGSGGTAEPFNELAVRPTRVAFYTMAQGVPDTNKNIPITGANTTVGALINPRSVIKVFFNGGVDYRTLYIDPKLNQTIDANCVATPASAMCAFGISLARSSPIPRFSRISPEKRNFCCSRPGHRIGDEFDAHLHHYARKYCRLAGQPSAPALHHHLHHQLGRACARLGPVAHKTRKTGYYLIQYVRVCEPPSP